MKVTSNTNRVTANLRLYALEPGTDSKGRARWELDSSQVSKAPRLAISSPEVLHLETVVAGKAAEIRRLKEALTPPPAPDPLLAKLDSLIVERKLVAGALRTIRHETAPQARHVAPELPEGTRNTRNLCERRQAYLVRVERDMAPMPVEEYGVYNTLIYRPATEMDVEERERWSGFGK